MAVSLLLFTVLAAFAELAACSSISSSNFWEIQCSNPPTSDQYSWILNSFVDFFKAVLIVDVPTIAAPFSDGVYVLNTSHPDFVFGDIQLVQRGSMSNNIVHSVHRYIWPDSGETSSIWQMCWGGKTWRYERMRLSQDIIPRNQHWCTYTPICKKLDASTCVIAVDPMRSSCVIAPLLVSVDETENSEEPFVTIEPYELQLTTLSQLGYDSLISNLYSIVAGIIDLLSSLFLDLSSVVSSLLSPFVPPPLAIVFNFVVEVLCGGWSWFMSLSENVILRNVHSVMVNCLDVIWLHIIPLRLMVLVIGWRVIDNADELAESKIFQMVVTGSAGLLLASIWLIAGLYRTINQTSPTSSSFITMLVGASVAVPYLCREVLTDSIGLGGLLYRQLALFWNTGYFGYSWLGKAYFISSLFGSFAIMKFYNLFDDGSYSQMALIATIKLIGVLFLSGCSGNIDIVCVIVLVSLIKESVEQQMYVNYVHFQGVWKIPSYKYSGKKKLSMDQYEKEGRSFTERELEKLRTHLVSNPMVVQTHSDGSYQNGNVQGATLLHQFVHGDFSGLPKNVEVQNQSLWQTIFMWIRWLLFALFVLIIVIVFLFILNS